MNIFTSLFKVLVTGFFLWAFTAQSANDVEAVDLHKDVRNSASLMSSTAIPPDANASILLSSAILDDFDQPDGPIGGDWSGSVTDYAIAMNQLYVGMGEDIYWNASQFGVNQEVFVTLATIDPDASEIGLILKAQSASELTPAMINVLYHPMGNYVQVWTHSIEQGWQQRGTNIPVTFENGDQFGAQAKATGDVVVYRNGVSVGIRSVSGWPFTAGDGYIGLFNLNANGTILDDFGGGTFEVPPPPPPCTDPLTCNPVSSIPAYWRCNTPGCTSVDWTGAVIVWPWWAAYESNNRAGENSRTVYAFADDRPLNAYMKEWADGCQITAVSGTVLIIEWERGTEVWRETYLNPGESHTIDLIPPENGVLIEGPDGVVDEFRVSLSNCTPPTVPLTIGETSILNGVRSGYGELLLAQQATLEESGDIESISMYIVSPSGQLRLGVYDDNDGSPGALVAETAPFTPLPGWNTQNVLTSSLLLPGNYWLAFLPENGDKQFAFASDVGISQYATYSFANLPNSFPDSPISEAGRFSIYATLSRSPSAVSLAGFTVYHQTAATGFVVHTAVLLSFSITLIFLVANKRQRRQSR